VWEGERERGIHRGVAYFGSFMSVHLYVLPWPFWGPKQCFFGMPWSKCR
jgi:hypothetical protein